MSQVRYEGREYHAELPFMHPADHLAVCASVTYKNGVRVSSELLKRPVRLVPGAQPTLTRQKLVDEMHTATDWSWVPAYTDPNREDATYFTRWIGEKSEEGFTLDPRMFDPGQPSSFHFGTRKVGDPQFRGQGDEFLVIDVYKDRMPETLDVLLRYRLPGQYGQEYRFSPPLPKGAAGRNVEPLPWHALRLERKHFLAPDGSALPDWQHVDWFVLKGTGSAGKAPVFKRLRWESEAQ